MSSLTKAGCCRRVSGWSGGDALRLGNGRGPIRWSSRIGAVRGRMAVGRGGPIRAARHGEITAMADQRSSLVQAGRASRILAPKCALYSSMPIGQKAHQELPWPPPRGRTLSAKAFREAFERFRVVMVRERQPFAFLGSKATTNVSNLCGHASFVTLALAYLETDVLALRGYALSGIALSIMFQFYRPQPLWIPIGWNGIFMVINMSMIALLLKETSDAEKLTEDPEQAAIFEEVFRPVELTPVDYGRLMEDADRRVVLEGEHLSEAGRVQEDVFLIVEGTAEVENEGVAVCHLEAMQFIGSMAFNRFIQASPPPTRRATSRVEGAVPDGETLIIGGSVATGGRSEGGSLVANDDVDKADHGNEEQHYIDDSYVPGGAGVFEDVKSSARDITRKDSFIGEIAKALVPNERLDLRGALERSGTTVTATSKVVVYAWDMYLLRAFMKRRPLAGASLQKAISADLTRKVDQSRGHEERYRLLLTEALDGGVITAIERKKLSRYRDMHGISADEHQEVLRQHNWKEEEYEAGFQKGAPPRDGSKYFLKYEALVRRELAKGEVEDEGRQNLRQFRAQAGIDAQEHLLALEKQGWTADDYEVGGKGKAADFDDKQEKTQSNTGLKAVEKAEEERKGDGDGTEVSTKSSSSASGLAKSTES